MNPPASEATNPCPSQISAPDHPLTVETPVSHLDQAEHELKQVPPCILGRMKKAKFGLVQLMHEVAEVRQVINNQNDQLLSAELVMENLER
jgi:hypothetical protein